MGSWRLFAQRQYFLAIWYKISGQYFVSIAHSFSGKPLILRDVCHCNLRYLHVEKCPVPQKWSPWFSLDSSSNRQLSENYLCIYIERDLYIDIDVKKEKAVKLKLKLIITLSISLEIGTNQIYGIVQDCSNSSANTYRRYHSLALIHWNHTCSVHNKPDKFDELVQERLNSIANALELRFSCTNP